MTQTPPSSEFGRESWAPPEFEDAPDAVASDSGAPLDEVFDAPAPPAPPAAAIEAGSEPKRRRMRATKEEKAPKPPKAEKPPKSEKAPRAKRKAKDAIHEMTSENLVPVIPVITAFDLLGGSYQRVIRARIAIMATAGVFALIAIVMLTLGLKATSSNSTNESLYNEQLAATSALNTKIGNATDYPPGTHKYLGTSMQADLLYRAPLIATAASGAPNTAEILSDLQKLAGPGIQVTGVNLSSTATTSSGSTVTTTPGSVAGIPVTVNIIATSASDLNNFETEMSRYSYIQDPSVTWTGAAPSLNATVSAKIVGLTYPTPSAATEALAQSHTAPSPTILPTTTTTAATNG